MPDPAPQSLWEVSAEEPDGDDGACLPESAADVIIIGGGYTGLSTALHCAEAGLSAQVLEAHAVGHGGSGRNVGLVNAGVWLPPGKVRSKLGQNWGPRFLKRFGSGPDAVFDLIEKHQIRCEARRAGTIHAAHAPSGRRDLERRWSDWRDLGAPVDLLSPEEMARMTGTNAFCGGLWDHRAGTVNPMAYCRGLARAARGAGARIATGVRATALRRDAAAGWRVITDRGETVARAVVLGTNAYSDDLWPGLKQSFTTIRFFQLATGPLGAGAAAILPGGQGLWDTGTIMFSLRRDTAGRLIIGSMGRLIGTGAKGLSHDWAQRKLARMFPDLGRVTFEDGWDGQIAMTPDHLPRIHRLADGLYTPIGYNGRGITTGTIFGQTLAGLLTGASPDDLPLPVTAVARDRWAPVKSRIFDLAFSANQVIARG